MPSDGGVDHRSFDGSEHVGLLYHRKGAFASIDNRCSPQHATPPCSSCDVPRKLLDRLNATPDPEPTPTDTVLGDWYANLIRVGRIQVVLAVSERTLLPVVVPSRDARSLAQRLSEPLGLILSAVGVPQGYAIAERGAMQSWAIGKTVNRERPAVPS